MPTIDQLDAAPAAGDTDEILVSQGGVSRKIGRAEFLAGFQSEVLMPEGTLLGRGTAGTGGVEVLQLGAGLTISSGTIKTVPLPTAAAVPVESYGAVGDGITDDSAAFAVAVSAGVPIKLGARTYVVNGQWTIAQAGTVLTGVPGATVLRRTIQTGNGAWISIQNVGFRAHGIIFDANRSAITRESWGVFVAAACSNAHFSDCAFVNSVGPTQGHGLTLQGGTLATDHVVRNCEFTGNASNGLWVQACSGVEVSGCRAHDNGQYGICADFNDPTFRLKVGLVQIISNRVWANLRGISVGNYNATNLQPPTWGNQNPDAGSITVQNNTCHDNAVYGIAVSGNNISVSENLVINNGVGAGTGGGILANAANSRVSGNLVAGGGTYGIDCGGSIAVTVLGNYIQGPTIGINAGGSKSVNIAKNYIQGCADWAVAVANVEADQHGQTFGIACNYLAISGNWISIPNTANGIWLRDGPQNILVERNNFTSSAGAEIAIRPDTDTVIIEGNKFNFQTALTRNPTIFSGRSTILYPDILNRVLVTYAPVAVQSILSSHQAASLGSISFVKVLAGGSGYTSASVTISGSGSGGSATAIVFNGSIVGVAVTAPGMGYGDIGTTFPVTIGGDGQGAQAIAYVSTPLPDGRQLDVSCNVKVTFARAGSTPLQENWSGADLDVAANDEVSWRSIWGSWRAAGATLSDFYQTDGTGGALVRSAGNSDVILRPAGSGHVRVSSDAEPEGAFCLVGRGSPQQLVVAPPGSDYRNLNGGAGSTFWIKQTGVGNTGWVPIG